MLVYSQTGVVTVPSGIPTLEYIAVLLRQGNRGRRRKRKEGKGSRKKEEEEDEGRRRSKRKKEEGRRRGSGEGRDVSEGAVAGMHAATVKRKLARSRMTPCEPQCSPAIAS